MYARDWLGDSHTCPGGYLPLLEPTVMDLSSTFGAKGDFAGWATDISIGYGRNRIGCMAVSISPSW